MTRNARRRDTRTIQTWPGGQSFEYRGDPDGPANQRSLRAGHYQARVRCPKSCDWYYHRRENVDAIPICTTCQNSGYVPNPVKNPWRKGTPEEWRQIRINLRAERYWEQHGRGCDSALVDDLIKAANSGDLSGDLASAFGYEELRNLYADPSDWDAERCREYASDNGIDLPDVPTGWGCADPRHETPCMADASGPCAGCLADGCDPKYWGEIPDPGAEEDDSRHGWLTEARDACRDHAQDDPAEVYEWYRVTKWLCDELHAIGEVTINNWYGCWWGRTCSGQMLLMDGTIQRVAARHEREEGA